jgi:chaperonin GroES
MERTDQPRHVGWPLFALCRQSAVSPPLQTGRMLARQQLRRAPCLALRGVRRSAVSRPVAPRAALASTDDLTLDKCAPLGKRVLFVADAEEEKTAGGILLPSSSSPRGAGFITGEVVAVGEGVDCVKPGTKALVSGYGGAEVDFQGRKARFVLDSDVIATLSS